MAGRGVHTDAKPGNPSFFGLFSNGLRTQPTISTRSLWVSSPARGSIFHQIRPTGHVTPPFDAGNCTVPDARPVKDRLPPPELSVHGSRLAVADADNHLMPTA